MLCTTQKKALVQNMKAVAKISKIAEARGVTAGQLALAWVHSRGEDVIPIPGTAAALACITSRLAISV